MRRVEQGGAQVDVIAETTVAEVGAGTHVRLPTVTLKRVWDGQVDRNVRQALEREGLSMSDPTNA